MRTGASAPPSPWHDCPPFKSLAGFVFAFQTSLDKQPHHDACRIDIHRSGRGRPSFGAARNRQDPSCVSCSTLVRPKATRANRLIRAGCNCRIY